MKKAEIPSGILQKIAEGNEAAIREFYDITRKPLFAFLLSYTCNYSDAEDLMQETYIKVLECAHMYREDNNPMAWLLKIAKNLFLMKCRKDKHNLNVEPREMEAYKEISFEQIDNIETRMWMEQLFQILTEEERLVVVMHLVVGLRHREIAQQMDLPLGTVLSKYHRALKKMEKSVKNEEGRS